MPKEPKGEKHPAEVNAAVEVTTGGGNDKSAQVANSENDVEASGTSPAKSETTARRKEIDLAASSPRWEG